MYLRNGPYEGREIIILTRNSSRPLFPYLIYFSLTVKAATLIFIPGRGSANPAAEEGRSGFMCNLVKR